MVLTKLRELNELIHKRPPLGILIAYLSNTASTSGLPVGIAAGSLYDNQNLVAEYAYGFSDNKSLIGLTRDLFQDTPASKALRTMQIIYLSYEDFSNQYHDFPAHLVSEFAFGILIPVDMQRFYGFFLKEEDSSLARAEEYFECIQSMLNIYHSLTYGMETQIGMSELTQRQRSILDLIRQNKSNPEIGNQLGYSESLIRQETISIYRKMGVHGRKDLVIKPH